MSYGLAFDHPKFEVNIGTAFRSAEAFGAKVVFTVGRRYRRQASDTPNVAGLIPVLHFETWDQAFDSWPLGWIPIGVEIEPGAKPIETFCHPKRAMYVFGAEDHGLTAEARRRCAAVIVLPGSRCLNVAAAATVVMYDRIAKEGDVSKGIGMARASRFLVSLT